MSWSRAHDSEMWRSLRPSFRRSSDFLCGVFVRVPPASSADITPTDAVLSPSNSDFSAAVAESGTDSVATCGNSDILPTQDDVVRKTDRITKRLQELFHAAQEGNCIWYALCTVN